MAYALTEQDITDMIAAGMNVMDAIPGAPATDAEKKFLGVQEDVEPNAFSEPVALAPAEIATQQASSFNPAGTTAQSPIMSVGDVGSQMQDLSAATPPVNMQGQLSAAQDASPSFLSSMGDTLFGPKEAGDQFANLNRQQRMMLAFGAVKDAGFALQGKESNSFSSTLKAINDQMDMGRKAKAAQAATDMFSSLSQGGGGLGSLPPNATPQDIDARIAKLTSLLASPAGASLAPYVTAEVQRLNLLKEQGAASEKGVISGTMGISAVDALLNSDQLSEITGGTGVWNSIKNNWGGAPEYAQLISYVEQLKGLNFLEAFQQLKGGGPVTDTEGNKATAARSRIDAALKGRPEDLREALLEVRALFQDAVRKNPYYTGPANDAPPNPTASAISPAAQAIIDERKKAAAAATGTN